MLYRNSPGLRTPFARVALPICAAAAAMILSGAAGDTIADHELGQPDLFHNSANIVDAFSMNNPNLVAVDTTLKPNRVWVADSGNNRVLGYKSVAALVSGAPANLVVGQPDFFSSNCNISPASLCSPQGVAVDGAGNLYVADNGESRVLEFNNPFAAFAASKQTAGFVASMVFGQGGDFYSDACNGGGPSASAGTLCNPTGVALDKSGDLFVGDTGNSRVLEYLAPLSSGLSAGQEFGQPDFVSTACNEQLTSTSENALCHPFGLAIDGEGDLFVADHDNSRVLEYSAPLTSRKPSLVFGQGGSFAIGICNHPAIGPDSLCSPSGVAFDGEGNLYVSDTGNSRVLQFVPPFGSSPFANQVFGQGGSMTDSTCNNGGIGASTMCAPVGVSMDSAGDLYVGDKTNSRLLAFALPFAANPSASVALGQPDLSHDTANTVDPSLDVASGGCGDRRDRETQPPLCCRYGQQPRARLQECRIVPQRPGRRPRNRAAGSLFGALQSGHFPTGGHRKDAMQSRRAAGR